MTVEPGSTRANRINSDSLDWSYIGISFRVGHSTSARPDTRLSPIGPFEKERKGASISASRRVQHCYGHWLPRTRATQFRIRAEPVPVTRPSQNTPFEMILIQSDMQIFLGCGVCQRATAMAAGDRNELEAGKTTDCYLRGRLLRAGGRANCLKQRLVHCSGGKSRRPQN